MDKVVSILIVMEMLVVNLFTVDICSHRKHSKQRTFFTLFLFTFLLTAITHSWWVPLGFNNGNALFTLVGIIYLIPLSFLYYDPLLRISGILFSAWIYTLLVYCLAVQISYIIPYGSIVSKAALIQSIIYGITLYPFAHWIKGIFLFVLQNIAKKNLYLLQAVSLCWFGSILLINGILIYPKIKVFSIIVIMMVSVDAILSYWLISSMFKSLKEVKSLQDIVYIDPLTNIYNREKLFVDANVLIKKKKPFRLVFMDLNHFKQINDQYGHQSGDRYLSAFAHTTKSFLCEGETLYRISGDEFIIISQAADLPVLVHKLRNYPMMLEEMNFLGCSIGWADYPKEASKLDALIALADKRMYQDKHPEVYNR